MPTQLSDGKPAGRGSVGRTGMPIDMIPATAYPAGVSSLAEPTDRQPRPSGRLEAAATSGARSRAPSPASHLRAAHHRAPSLQPGEAFDSGSSNWDRPRAQPVTTSGERPRLTVAPIRCGFGPPARQGVRSSRLDLGGAVRSSLNRVPPGVIRASDPLRGCCLECAPDSRHSNVGAPGASREQVWNHAPALPPRQPQEYRPGP